MDRPRAATDGHFSLSPVLRVEGWGEGQFPIVSANSADTHSGMFCPSPPESTGDRKYDFQKISIDSLPMICYHLVTCEEEQVRSRLESIV
jgi:hypothetical protein